MKKILIKVLLRFVNEGPIDDDKSALFQEVIACCR